MKLSEHVANYVFEKLTSIQNGATIEDVRTALEGLDSKLQGLSDDERVKLFEDTPVLKSHTDGRVTRALEKKKDELEQTFNSERQNLNSTIQELRALVPEKDLEALKKDWLEADEKDKPAKKQAYEYAKLKSDFDAMQKKAYESEMKERKAELINLAKSEFGDRNIPKFFNIDAYIGSDKEETMEKVKLGIQEYDEFMKTVKASTVEGQNPPANEDSPTDIGSSMKSVGNF